MEELLDNNSFPARVKFRPLIKLFPPMMNPAMEVMSIANGKKVFSLGVCQTNSCGPPENLKLLELRGDMVIFLH